MAPHKDERMHEQFGDPAVPDGAETMSDDWLSAGSPPVSSAGTQESAPPVDPATGEVTFMAMCNQCSVDSQTIGWQGPPREIRLDAVYDAADHNRYSGHEAWVWPS